VSPRPAADPVVDQTPTLALNTFADVVALAAEKRDIGMKLALERDVRLVRCEDGQLELALEQSAAKGLVHELQRKLTEWTGRRWIVVVSKEQGEPTLRARAEAQDAEIKRGVQSDPLVQAVLERFPGATIVGVTQPPPPKSEDVIAPPPEEEEED
ncbi:MAG: DNA polymerase III subunit gamma/tau, partial [Pseudolabrys sp.]